MQKLEKIDGVLSGAQKSELTSIQSAVVDTVRTASVSENRTDKFAVGENIVVDGKHSTAEHLILKDGHYDLPFKFTGVFDAEGFSGTIVPA